MILILNIIIFLILEHVFALKSFSLKKNDFSQDSFLSRFYCKVKQMINESRVKSTVLKFRNVKCQCFIFTSTFYKKRNKSTVLIEISFVLINISQVFFDFETSKLTLYK